MSENTELMTADNICNRVYIIRGQQVMLDYDLAEIYGYEVRAFKIVNLGKALLNAR